MTWTRWTDKEKEILRDKYGRIDTDKLAADLGRTPKQVREAAKRFCKLKAHNSLSDHREELLLLHSEGKSCPVIAKKLGVPVRTVEFWLRGEGLSGNGWCDESCAGQRIGRMSRWLVRNQRLVWKAIRAVARKFSRQRIEAAGGLDEVYAECVCEILKRSKEYSRKLGSSYSGFAYRIAYYRALAVINEWGVIRTPRGPKSSKTHADAVMRARGACSFESIKYLGVEKTQDDSPSDVAEALAQLNAFEQELLLSRIGEGESLRIVMEKHGVTNKRLMQLEIECALNKLRKIYFRMVG